MPKWGIFNASVLLNEHVHPTFLFQNWSSHVINIQWESLNKNLLSLLFQGNYLNIFFNISQIPCHVRRRMRKSVRRVATKWYRVSWILCFLTNLNANVIWVLRRLKLAFVQVWTRILLWVKWSLTTRLSRLNYLETFAERDIEAIYPELSFSPFAVTIFCQNSMRWRKLSPL